MTSRQIRFIIPAAGHAVRFGGIPKELLPISSVHCGLTYAIQLAQKLGRRSPVVISNPEKEAAHRAAIQLAGVDAELLVNPLDKCEMWDSVRLGLDTNVAGGLIMPDTIPQIEYEIDTTAPITFGCFQTHTPWNFSCLDIHQSNHPKILTKPQITRPMLAWGLVFWQEGVGSLLDTHSHFDKAFESIMQTEGYGWFLLKRYVDLGSFELYRDFISSPHARELRRIENDD